MYVFFIIIHFLNNRFQMCFLYYSKAERFFIKYTYIDCPETFLWGQTMPRGYTRNMNCGTGTSAR